MNVSIFGHVITNLILSHDTSWSRKVFVIISHSVFNAHTICKHGPVLLQTNTLSLPSDVTSPASIFCTTSVPTAPSTCRSNHRDVIFHTNRPEVFDGINRMSSFPTRFNLLERCKKCFTASTGACGNNHSSPVTMESPKEFVIIQERRTD